MGKFKVGDVVRFKPREELIKIASFDAWVPKYKALAGKIVKICEIRDDYYLIQDGQVILASFFPEWWFEDVGVLVET